MAVLYRKYRPQTFSQVLGQKYIIQTLKNQVSSGQVAHAYLFCGSRGVGKTSIARILAKAVNCLNGKGGDACGACEICKQIEGGNFLDLVEIDAASNTGVDNIRELIEHVKFSPSVGKYKVFIIDEVHMLSKGAFNALLKTLEEPPKHAMFILATTEINKVPTTIISRTQRFDFRRLDAQDIQRHLQQILAEEKAALPADILALVAQNADGSVRDSLSLLDKILTLGEHPSREECEHLLGVTDIGLAQELMQKIIGQDSGSIPDFIDSLLERGVDFSIFNRDFLEYLRKLLVAKVTEGQILPSLQPEHLSLLQRQTTEISAGELMLVIRLFLKSYKDLSVSPSPQLPVLLAALESCFRKKTAMDNIVPAKPVPRQNQQPEAEAALTVDPPSGSLPAASPEITLTVEEVRQGWPAAIDKVKRVNISLANLMKNSAIESVSDGRIVLGVKFAFHKQHLEHSKNHSLISSIFRDIYNQPVGLKAVVVKEESQGQADRAEALAEALKVFGGELIE